jgi:hypothetical protein
MFSLPLETGGSTVARKERSAFRDNLLHQTGGSSLKALNTFRPGTIAKTVGVLRGRKCQTLIREGGIRTTRPSTTVATGLPARLC